MIDTLWGFIREHQDFIILLLKILVPFLIIFNIIPLLIWVERKGSAYIQDRRGPNRASLFGIRAGGLLHSLSDVIKLLTKEDIIPSQVNKPFYIMAPFLTLSIACVTYAVIPFGDVITATQTPFVLQAANINVGILYTLAMASLGVFGIMLAGWSANNKYALLGGLRSSAQMFSYEISMGLSILTVLMIGGSFELGALILDQSAYPWKWNFLRAPLACLIFIVASFAETNRTPFDLPEGEAELVAGYHVEYSSMKFAMFFMAEYANMIIASAMIAILFFGGWQVPFLPTEFLRANANTALSIILIGHGVLFLVVGGFLLSKFKKGHYGDNRDNEVLILGVPFLLLGLGLTVFTFLHGSFNLSELGRQVVTAFIQFGMLLGKILFFCWVFIWVRWTLPRFRYDQLMHLGWKVMIPLSLVSLCVTAVVMYLVA